MAIVQCENHHYYDDKRDASCPYCAKMADSSTETDDIREQLTSYADFATMEDDAQLTEAYGENVGEYDKTIGLFTDGDTQNVCTVGWLVCVNGPARGKSYPLHAGRNFAGRSPDMDMVLSDDKAISRDKHFSIVYDPRGVRFYVVAGCGQTYWNQQAVLEEQEIRDGDEIVAGESHYIFVPFCREGRVWDEKNA